jgi:prepilin-type N-terminal cleavage/methylation domain-containing protein
MIHSAKKGFSLIELIVVVAIMAVLAAVIVPSVSGTREAAEEQAAKAAAGTLNLAQSQWRLVTNNVASWPGATNQSGCYDQIKQFMEYADTDWATFQKRYNENGGGYTLSFQSLDGNGKMQKVILTDKSGNTVAY